MGSIGSGHGATRIASTVAAALVVLALPSGATSAAAQSPVGEPRLPGKPRVLGDLAAAMPRRAPVLLGRSVQRRIVPMAPVDGASRVVGRPIVEPERLAGHEIASADGGADRADPGPAFRIEQLRHPRVRMARAATEATLRRRFAEQGVAYPPAGIFFRVFKVERVLELWARAPGSTRYVLVGSYPTCNTSGRLGPKRQRGDLQVPEGFYTIDAFNPASEFHLSLHVDYPNAADRLLGVRGDWGGGIYIHGDCVTVGCVAVTDGQIMELYWAAVEARAAGQRRIPVHIFPTRLDDGGMRWLRATFPDDADRLGFWSDLKVGYDYFERERRPPRVIVGERGEYRIETPDPVD